MKVSLVMPTWNAGPLLEEVLAAVDRQPGADAIEKIAVDSGSSDGTVERLCAHGFDVFGIAQRDFNHGATRDLAIERATGEIVLLLTQDATPADERWLPSLVECYADPDVGAAYCRQIPRADCNPFIARRIAEWTAGKTERVVQRLGDRDWDALAPLDRLQLCAYDNVAGSVRRNTWQRFRFGHRAFGEDVAFGKQLIRAGHSIVFEPNAAVIHSHNRSPREEGRRIYCDHQNLRELFDVHLLPTRDSLLGAIDWGRREYAKIVDSLDIDAAQKLALHAWARSYAKWGAVGMHLGANSRDNMRGPRAALFTRLDARFHRGI